MMKSRILLWAALAAAHNGAAQAPLRIDTTFRADLPSQNVYSVLPLADGKVIISGQLQFSDLPNQRAGARLLPNGQRDPAFNQGFLPMGGKLTAWGNRFYCSNGPGGIRRFHMDGTLDNTFNFVGQWQQVSAMSPGDYHVYPDGSVLLGGYYDLNDPAHGYYPGVGYNLAWITPEGRLDTTRTHRTGNGTVKLIKEYPAGTSGGLAGRFLVYHYGSSYEGQPVGKVFRIHADGSLDNSFSAPIAWGSVWTIGPLPDGRAYLGGMFRLENQTDTIQLIRVLPDGSLDPTFNNGLNMVKGEGFTFWDAGVVDLLPLESGLIIVTGFFAEVEGQPYNGICMLDTLGNVVPYYFQGGGCGSYDYQLGQMIQRYGSIDGIARAPSGDYYIWGAYHGYSDGTTNDTLQRMVTRLHGGEIGLGVAERKPETRMRLYPNPANTSLTLELEDVPHNTELVLRDALGREVMRRRLTGHATTVALHGLAGGAYMAEVQQGGKRLLPAERLVIGP